MPRADREGAAARLETELGARPPQALVELEDDHLEHLAGVIAAARRRQAAELAAAGERGLRFVPRLLRGPLRKALR